MKAIVNASIVLESGILYDGALLEENGKIVAVGKAKDIEIPAGAEIIDAGGAYVGPGFVDIHVHGGGGYNTYENPKAAAEHFLKHGATTILATPLYSQTFEELIESFRLIREEMKTNKSIKGIYSEGPYTNPDYGCNSHHNPWRGAIDMDKCKALVDAAGEDVLVWTVAPEREDLKAFLEYARKVNPKVIFALGHSEATPEQIREQMPFPYQPTILTHAMNATGTIGESHGLRGRGPDEYCAKEDEMYAELISDSCAIHVKPDMQQMLLHNKGVGKVILITDSTTFDGAPPEKYSHVTDLSFDDRGGIAGSRMTMDQACRNIMQNSACGIAQAFLMASTNPARAVGLYDTLGSVAVGKNADLVFTDDMFNILKVMQEGELCVF